MEKSVRKPLYKPQTGDVDINVNVYNNESCIDNVVAGCGGGSDNYIAGCGCVDDVVAGCGIHNLVAGCGDVHNLVAGCGG
ncbi:MAG: hypothetical protein LBF87_09295 [Treponema sp.]|jgi:hypothetical protein|nr:hypothetical protein [Treponema sp.]